jgi:hypothetical protein
MVPSGAVDCEHNANQAGIDDDLPEIMDHRVALGAVIAAKIAIAGIAFGYIEAAQRRLAQQRFGEFGRPLRLELVPLVYSPDQPSDHDDIATAMRSAVGRNKP